MTLPASVDSRNSQQDRLVAFLPSLRADLARPLA